MSKNINWKNIAQEYYDENGSDDSWVFEVVDSYMPIYYSDIAQEAMRLNLLSENIEKGWVDRPFYEAFQMLIFIEYESLFMQEYNEILEEEE